MIKMHIPGANQDFDDQDAYTRRESKLQVAFEARFQQKARFQTFLDSQARFLDSQIPNVEYVQARILDSQIFRFRNRDHIVGKPRFRMLDSGFLDSKCRGSVGQIPGIEESVITKRREFQPRLRRLQPVRAPRYKCLHENIAGKHCQQCFLTDSTAPGDADRRQMPSAKKKPFILYFR